MKFVDYYAALGIPRDADLGQIKKAYRTLARLHHPDVSKLAGSEEKFKNAAAAYATLKNPEKRAAYDALGPLPEGTDLDAPPPGARSARHAQNARYEDMDFTDFLDSLRQGEPFGTSRGRAHGPRRGRDLEDTVSITLEQALHGSTLHLEMQDGAERKALEVTVPAGVRAGQKLRLRGKGGKGSGGGDDGDCFLHIAWKSHPRFRIDQNDLYFDLALTPWEAALGAEITVATLDADVVLTVPAGSSSAKKLRLRGRGMPQAPSAAAARGDLYALLRIEVPNPCTAEERKLFEELARVSTFAPRTSSTGTPP